MKVGDKVRIVKRSVKYNPHIFNVGYEGYIDEIDEGVIQGTWYDKYNNISGIGAVDSDCVELIEEHQDYIPEHSIYRGPHLHAALKCLNAGYPENAVSWMNLDDCDPHPDSLKTVFIRGIEIIEYQNMREYTQGLYGEGI